MKNLKWVILIVVAFLLGWYVAEMRQPPVEKPPAEEPETEKAQSASVKPPDWLKVAVGVSYDSGQVAPPDIRGRHDTAILDQDSDLEFVLNCGTCPQGADDKTRWRIDKFVRVADLTRVADTLIEMYKDKSIQSATREELGLFEYEEEVDIRFSSNSEPVGTPITAEVEDPISLGGELWKYYLEVSTCDGTQVEDCSQEPESWIPLDPHVWAHDRNS